MHPSHMPSATFLYLSLMKSFYFCFLLSSSCFSLLVFIFHFCPTLLFSHADVVWGMNSRHNPPLLQRQADIHPPGHLNENKQKTKQTNSVTWTYSFFPSFFPHPFSPLITRVWTDRQMRAMHSSSRMMMMRKMMVLPLSSNCGSNSSSISSNSTTGSEFLCSTPHSIPHKGRTAADTTTTTNRMRTHLSQGTACYPASQPKLIKKCQSIFIFICKYIFSI